MVDVATQDLNQLNSLDLDDLYARLAIADAGTTDVVDSGFKKLELVASVLNVGVGNKFKLIELGKKIFEEYWPMAKDYVCENWNGDDSPIKDWIEDVGEGIANLLGVPGKVAVLVLTIAVKLGFNALCAAEM